jgi:hypothetical protein
MKIWVTENNVVHHRKPRSVATVEYVQASELADAVKVIEFYADKKNQEDHAIIDVMPNRNGEPMEYISDFNNEYNLDKGQRARDFLAKIER